MCAAAQKYSKGKEMRKTVGYLADLLGKVSNPKKHHIVKAAVSNISVFRLLGNK
jgi:major membrane immunogen (membrane-anchored lipoprotein)